MKQIIAWIMSIITALFGGGLGAIFGDRVEAMPVQDWLVAVSEEFGMEAADSSAALQTAREWGIITDDDDFGMKDGLTNEIIAVTLVRAAGLELKSSVDIANGKALDYPEEVAIAVSNGLFELTDGKFKVKKIAVKESLAILAAAKGIWSTKAFTDAAEYSAKEETKDFTNEEYLFQDGKIIFADSVNLWQGDKFIVGSSSELPTGGAYVAENVEYGDGLAVVNVSEIELKEAVDEVDVQGTVDADLSKAKVLNQKGEVIQNAVVDEKEELKAEETSKVGDIIDGAKEKVSDFLANPSVSFSANGFKVKGAYTDGRVDISVAGNVVNNVRVEKSYSLSDISCSAKFDANIASVSINEAYVVLDYDLLETTVLQGSYAAAVYPEDLGEDADPVDFLTRVKEGLFEIREGSNVQINVFTFEIPVGTTGLTVDMNISLTLSACGRIEMIVTSNETKGYEIINNRGRYISESTVYDRIYNISGDFQVVLGIRVGLSFLGFLIVDVEVKGGIGAYVITTVFAYENGELVDEDAVNMPYDVAVEVTSGLDCLEDIKICANVQLYGILTVSVGENSLISKIGLSKTWTIYDRSNAVFAELHIEETGIVDQCTRAAS